MEYKRIPVTEVGGFRIGNAQTENGCSGCTVVIFDGYNRGGIDISGGGAACRESMLLDPLSNPHDLNAVLFSGGSAYSLDAAGGVMRYLEERGIGFKLGNMVIPLVCQSDIFDLPAGHGQRPDADIAYKACLDSESGKEPISGNVGAGTGATVGKVHRLEQADKAGIGYYAIQVGKLKIGALVVVNAFGDVFDYHTGKKIAGVKNKERTAFLDIEEELCKYYEEFEKKSLGNTTIGAVFTNAKFTQPEMNKIASMARSGMARCINPVGTMADGDTIYAFSTGEQVTADISMVGMLAAKVFSEAILDAVKSAKMTDEDYFSKVVHK